jgi:hypothetical protein
VSRIGPLPIGNEDAWTLFASLFPNGASGFVEVRAIFPDQKVVQHFVGVEKCNWAYGASRGWAESADVYIGVAPRTREEGTKDAVEEVHTAWVDLDREDAANRLVLWELPPAAVVASGTEGHLHAYWPLAEPASPQQIEAVNRALAARLGADPAVAHASGVMRMPGTYNFKHDPPSKAKLVHCDERRFALDELWAVLGGEPANESPVAESRVSAPVAGVLERLEEVTESGSGWKARCPAHDDQQPSLQIDEGDDGRCLLHCFAGCATETIVAELGLQMQDLFADRPKRRRGSSRLMDLAVQAGIEVFHSRERIAYAAIALDRHRETWPVRSPAFGLWLRKLHYEAAEEALGDEVLGEAAATFEAKALFAGEEREVHRRVAGAQDRIFVDLGDDRWRAIEVTDAGWEVVDDPPIHFVRDSSALALPEPIRGGSIEDLERFANCANEASWLRLCGFLTMCFNPAGPFPVASVTGEQGTAKSTLSRLIVSLVDPRTAPLMMGTPTVRDLAVSANSVWLVGFDNVSKVSPALSDAFCQLTTGGGYRTRQLYTDGETFVVDLKRPVLLNAIGQVIQRPDLLDRVAPIELAPIQPLERRPEDLFWAEWEKAHPRVLGAILDGVSAALAAAQGIKLDDFPRMADFARWGEAAGAAYGWTRGAFTAALEGARDDLLEGSAEAYPEIGAVIDFMEAREEWVGSATDLLAALADSVDEKVAASRDWPKRADVLSNRLVQHAPLLRSHGIEAERGREGGGQRQRFIRLTSSGDAGTPGDAS